MKQDNHIVITKKEVLHLLGIKTVTLAALEGTAGITETSKRMGYTSNELELLKTTLRKISTNKRLF